MKNKILSLLILFIFSSEIFSSEEKCHALSATNEKMAPTVVDFMKNCQVAKTFAQEKDIQNEHTRGILKNFSEKLAIQIKQNSQELSLLDKYYS